MDADAPATEQDIHVLAAAMPHTLLIHTPSGKPVYQVGRKSFVYFRTPRRDAADPKSGEPYDDVVIFWVAGEGDKQALVQDPDTPFFTSPHFNGHSSVLIRLSRIGELTVAELAETIEDAWLSRASARRGAEFLRGRGEPFRPS